MKITPAHCAARALRHAGISAIPIRADGSKAPAVPAWAVYNERLPTPEEIERLFAGAHGIAVIGGPVSGNLEILDFDAPHLYEPWAALVDILEPGLVERLPMARTPSGGVHLFYRHDGRPEGNRKLAQEMTRDADGSARPTTLIETRGMGGYAIIPPSSAACHPDGRPYVMARGSIGECPVLRAEERVVLIDASEAQGTYSRAIALQRAYQRAREYNEISSGGTPGNGVRGGGGGRPGDDYNARARWDDLLGRHGWRAQGRRGDVTAWCRPGKGAGISATTGHGGANLLYVFSSNAAPFEPNTGYSLFIAYALLEHRGDVAAAAGALAAQGYGEPRG